jgi:glycosyltransferase involved in cell wall biosynthesis
MHIRKTIKSVLGQTVRPVKWGIVDDASTDKTENAVKEYLSKAEWIDLIRRSDRDERNFAAKAFAFNVGYEGVRNQEYDVIGCLDADVSFDADYSEFLLAKFVEDLKLGVAGAPFFENGYSSIEESFGGEKHVAGGVQLFRRECFEDIGGYIPNKAGGIDWIAVTTARMKGGKT